MFLSKLAPLALAFSLLLPTFTSGQNVSRNPSSIANQATGEPSNAGAEPTHAARALEILADQERPLDERIAEAARLVASDPEQAIPWAVLGELRLEAGESDTALLAFDRAVAKDPTLASSWHWIGTLRKRQGDLPGALDAFQKALANGAPRSQQMNEIAVTLAQLGRTDDALKQWDQAIEEDPNWGVLYTNAMKGALQRGNERLARQYFQRGLEAERFEEVMVLMWGDQLLERGREREALEVYEAGLARRADSPRMLYAYGMTLKERRRTEEAVAALEKSRAAATAQDDLSARETAAKALFSIQHPQAHQRLVSATEKINTPWSDDTRLAREMLEAAELLDGVIAEHSELWEPYLLRGTALRRLGDLDSAKEDFETVLSSIPEQPNALINLALVEQLNGEMESAMALADRAVAASGGDWYTPFQAGFIYLEAGDCTRAREMVRESRRRLPRGFPEDPPQVLADEIAAICG